MKRTQVQLDDRIYEALRRRAYEQGKSLAAVVRETLAEAFGMTDQGRRWTLKDFKSIGIGRSRQGTLAPVSERHDEALAEAIWRRKRPRR